MLSFKISLFSIFNFEFLLAIIFFPPLKIEIQNSNMSKLGKDGKPIYREDGKVLKGPNYFKPNIEKILNS